ncbi:MAG: restriction endonuclease subunit S [Pseudomonadota bacterium]|nr:restriction endonuclease subunit S [Pseudomonadota bacterium]
MTSQWKGYVLTQLAEYHNGYGFNKDDWGKEGFPIVRIEQLNNPDASCDYYNGPVLEVNKIDDGDLIFSWSATLKVVIWCGGKAVLNQHLFRVDPRSFVDKKFLYFLLDFHMEKLGGASHGSTMKHIKRSELDRYAVNVPALETQKKIATILSTIDSAIEKTEALIEKYQNIKTGLMQDLFTRGLLPNGQLRPPREQAPELYQKTDIGWIPRNWSVDVLDNLTSKIVDGVHHTPSYVEHGVPFVTVKNLTYNRDIDFTRLNYISAADHAQFSKRVLPQVGDVLVTKDGTLGVSRIVTANHPEFSIFVSVALLRPVFSKITSSWLNYFFDANLYLRQLAYLSAGTGLKHIHLEHFRKFMVPLPSIDEQQLIDKRIALIEDYLSNERAKLEKLRTQKLGLMKDLLTGDAPVSVDDSSVEPQSSHG